MADTFCTEQKPINHSPDQGIQKSGISGFHAGPGERFDISFGTAEIIFILSGRITIFYEDRDDITVVGKHIMFFPPTSRITLTAGEDTFMLRCMLRDPVRLGNEYMLGDLLAGSENPEPVFSPLPFNDKIETFINGFIDCINDGLKCGFYLDAKFNEMFFLFGTYYTKNELRSFFSPMISRDMRFSQTIWNNYRKVGTVAQLAEVCHYSVSRFKSKFKEVFGVPALVWLNEQRAVNIYFDLKYSDKSLVEISEEYHFASLSYLSTFCKKNLSMSPKEIRNKRKKK